MNSLFESHTKALNAELTKATGCTEPIALAFCAAYARDLLDGFPRHITVHCSGNIIKNVKSVTVPHTGGRKGIETAVLAGMISGGSQKGLEVLADFTSQSIDLLGALLGKKGLIEIRPLDTKKTLHVILESATDTQQVSVELVDEHTNIGRVTKNGRLIKDGSTGEKAVESYDTTGWSVATILEYAEAVDLSAVRDNLQAQIDCNTSIAAVGLDGGWGTGLGKIILDGASPNRLYKAAAVAGSDARMSGCPLPVVINSGSGNQGLTVSLPIIEYARVNSVEHEKLLRALCVSNLLALHQKAPIGRLSAFCGAVSAATAAVCGIAWLEGAGADVISLLIVNSLGTIGGMVCDGAKASCSAKISAALDAAFSAYDMARLGKGFADGEGIVRGDADSTIMAVGAMAAKGMVETDRVILDLMVGRR